MTYFQQFSGYCTVSTLGTQSPANYFDSRLASSLASTDYNFEKMELNFLQVILSFQYELTPSKKLIGNYY